MASDYTTIQISRDTYDLLDSVAEQMPVKPRSKDEIVRYVADYYVQHADDEDAASFEERLSRLERLAYEQ